MGDLSDVFADLPESIQRGIRDLGWTEPTPVQAKVIEPMSSGADLMVQAHTGSGKTGAFGIPITAGIDTELAACQALVLAPTRELANQVCAEIQAIGRHKQVRCVPIYGGVGYADQIAGIEAGAHVVVGTPGRMLDHLGSGRLSFEKVKTLIFDEADELLSLGFWPDMREINSYLPKRGRQSCLFSATIPERVQSLARVFLHEPRFVSLSEGQLAPQEIQHFFVVTTAQEKDVTLVRILEHDEPDSAIIFCNTKSDVRYITAYLKRRGFDADQISGDLTQSAREQAMASIKSGKLRFLVATDVAARGIDISDLTHVIGYSSPESPEVYIHRTGRTGRAGKSGVAISLVSGLDIGNFRQLQQVNQIKITERKIPTVQDINDRLHDRLAVKIEQEVRGLPEREREWNVDRFVPIVEALIETDEGKRDLAAICAAYLREHRPETSVAEAPKADAREEPPRPRRSGSGSGSGPKKRQRRRR